MEMALPTSLNAFHSLDSTLGAEGKMHQVTPPILSQYDRNRCLTSDDRLSLMKELNHPVVSFADEEISLDDVKRSRESEPTENKDEGDHPPTKKQRMEGSATNQSVQGETNSNAPALIPPCSKGTNYFNDSDVLSGRGGGTNVHPGNRNFRDLINMHRRAYLKARKNDKPAISRAIVKAIRDNNGRFLKKDEKTGLWFEIGDDAAREKTSQALRQRAPEMRKLLFDSEREEARAAAEEHLRQQQRMMMGMTSDINPRMTAPAPMMNPALFAMANKNALSNIPNVPSDPYTNMFSAALIGGGVNRFTPNGA